MVGYLAEFLFKHKYADYRERVHAFFTAVGRMYSPAPQKSQWMVTFSFLGRFLWFYTFGLFTDSRLNMLRNVSVRVVSYVFHVCICAFYSLVYFGSVYDWSQ